MKKRIVTTALFLAMGFTAAFANNKGIHDEVAASFAKDFSNAKEVKWEKQNRYEIATFSLNGMVMKAYYDDAHASLIALVHHILTDRLPIYLMTNLQNNYRGYWVTELYELTNGKESHYQITIENADHKLVMNSVSGTDWVVENKIKKV